MSNKNFMNINVPGASTYHTIAASDLAKAKELKLCFERAEKETGIDKSLLAAIASRESNIGTSLSKDGYGFDGHGFGIMQVDDRYHTPDKTAGPTSYDNIKHGSQILKDSISQVERKHPNWTPEQQLKGGIAAYNFGVKNVQTVENTDKGTTGNNYSSDVVARAQYFKQNGF